MVAYPGNLQVNAMQAAAFETVTQLRTQRDFESAADGRASPHVVVRVTVK